MKNSELRKLTSADGEAVDGENLIQLDGIENSSNYDSLQNNTKTIELLGSYREKVIATFN